MSEVKCPLHLLLLPQTISFCISDDSMIDMCSTMTRTSKSVYLHHSSFGPYSSSSSLCTCIISPTECNNATTFKFRAIDISLHNRHNLSSCTEDSRLELIGQREIKTYRCKENEFLRGFEKYYDSRQNGMELRLYTAYMQYPTHVLLEVKGKNKYSSLCLVSKFL